MTRRREFTAAIKVEIRKRATQNGVVYCEGCQLPARQWHIDHITADAFQTDKRRRLTAAEGQLLCAGSRWTCHGVKTAEDIPAIAKAKRREAKHLGVRKPSSFPARVPRDRTLTKTMPRRPIYEDA